MLQHQWSELQDWMWDGKIISACSVPGMSLKVTSITGNTVLRVNVVSHSTHVIMRDIHSKLNLNLNHFPVKAKLFFIWCEKIKFQSHLPVFWLIVYIFAVNNLSPSFPILDGEPADTEHCSDQVDHSLKKDSFSSGNDHWCRIKVMILMALKKFCKA